MDIYKQKIKEKVKGKLSNFVDEEILEDGFLENIIEYPKDKTMGDYSIVCFKLSKILKKNPIDIANFLNEQLQDIDGLFNKTQVVNGFLNLYVNKSKYVETQLRYIEDEINKEEYETGKGKNVCIDYSSPNIAKDFHIGHLRTTLIGHALYNLYKKDGYNITSINHLGDYGTQFGKLIEGIKLFGNGLDFGEKPIEYLTQIYVKISELSKNDENVLNKCRENFKQLELGNEECVKLYNAIKEISIKEFNKVYEMLNIGFDSWNGEAFYVDKMQEVVDILAKNNKLVKSQGATIVDLSQDGIETPLLIKKSDDSSTYATRDLAAVIYRARNYNYDKSLYVTSNEQTLHFKQIFATAKYLDLEDKYVKGLEHVSYGMVLLPTGKMSTRGGNVVRLKDLFEDAIDKAKEIIGQKNPNLENKDEIAKKVGLGAVIFNDLATSRNKDEIFKLEDILNFQGETGPYIQYTYVRALSVLEKLKEMNIDEKNLKIENIDSSILEDTKSVELIGEISKFKTKVEEALEKSEPSIFARYILNIAKLYSAFYNENKVVGENKELALARGYLTKLTADILKEGCAIMGIEMPNKM